MDILQLLDKKKKYQEKVSSYIMKRDRVELELEKMCGDSFCPLRQFLAEELFKTLPEKTKELINKEREAEEERKRQKELSDMFKGYEYDWNTSYSARNYFNPFTDKFLLNSYVYNEDKTKVKIDVECVHLRQYLGVTGCWIMTNYQTDWIDVEKLKNIN